MGRALAIIIGLNLIEGLCLYALLFYLGPYLGFWEAGAGTYALLGLWIIYEALTFWPKAKGLVGKRDAGADPTEGLIGTVLIELAPKGRVKVRGENWLARSLDGHHGVGDEVRVIARRGGELEVASPEWSAPPPEG